jgi:hypothetical protein
MKIGLRNKIMLIAAPCAGVLGTALMSPVSANVITGNPSTDGGWTSEGMSSSASNYIDGTGNYNATIYSTAFQLDASSPLLSTLGGFDWNVGDTVVGVGGVFSGSNTDLTYSGGADENGNSHTGATSTRIVVKCMAPARQRGRWTLPRRLARPGTGRWRMAESGRCYWETTRTTFIPRTRAR